MNGQVAVIDVDAVLTVDSRPNPLDHRWHLKGNDSLKTATHSAANHCFLGHGPSLQLSLLEEELLVHQRINRQMRKK
jgi:hypothetical protein